MVTKYGCLFAPSFSSLSVNSSCVQYHSLISRPHRRCAESSWSVSLLRLGLWICSSERLLVVLCGQAAVDGACNKTRRRTVKDGNDGRYARSLARLAHPLSSPLFRPKLFLPTLSPSLRPSLLSFFPLSLPASPVKSRLVTLVLPVRRGGPLFASSTSPHGHFFLQRWAVAHRTSSSSQCLRLSVYQRRPT